MKAISVQQRLCVLSVLCALAGCSSDDAAKGAPFAIADAAVSDTAKSVSAANGGKASAGAMAAQSPKADAKAKDAATSQAKSSGLTPLQWKRNGAFEADLSRALELPVDSLCREFGTASCIREVHLVPLGGSNPFTTGMFEPAAEPLASTPTVVERVVLSACSQRVELDASAGSDAKVFTRFALDKDARAPGAGKPRDGQVTDLFQRLLARDPSAAELTLVGGLAQDESGTAIAARDFAKLACFTVGTSAEFLFF